MNPALDGLLQILLFAAVGAAMLYSAKLARDRRRKRMAAWAAQRGYRFTAEDPQLSQGFAHFEPFGRGHSRKARHVVRGTVAGNTFVVFQYEYTTGYGKNREHHVHQICALRMPLSSPGLVVRREHVGHKIFDALGGEDIDFESDEFSRRFWVRSPDRRFAYDILHPRMMEYLMPLDRYLWQWKGKALLLSTADHIEPARAEAMLNAAAGLVALLPRHLPEIAA